MYGITETTVHVTYKNILEGENTRSNIGRPLDDLQVYVLDQNLNPVPIGVIGELYIGGAGLARGYLNQEGLTRERFIDNPFASATDRSRGYTRLYKTGDLVRWLSDGNLEYIGRNDEQVKIRGYRVELGEVEQAMAKIPGIKQSCVVSRERETGTGLSKYLVGYYVLDNDEDILPEPVVLERLSQVLPDYMIPSRLVVMESFPLTINGKLDKRALPDAEFSSAEEEYVAPTTEIEIAMCEIWQDVLGLDRVGVTDNFFRIGGDSILSIQVSTRIRQAGFNCQVKDIFTYKTVARLSEHLRTSKSPVSIQSEQGVLTGELGLLPVQQWFIERVERGELSVPHHWNQSFLVRVPELDEVKLSSVIEKLVAYHDVLRIQYLRVPDGTWQQLYQSHITIPELKSLDVRDHTSVEVQRILTDWQSDFSLEQGRLFVVGYLYGYEDGSARVYFALHHMIVDGVSWRILAEDLKTLYAGKRLQEKGSSYRQWVECIKSYPLAHPTEASYWREQLSGIPFHEIPEDDDGNLSMASLELDSSQTQSLLQQAPKAYHTEVNDLLLTALAYALKDINQNSIQGITLEGHGREEIDASIDHSHTVGWYTSMFPVRLEVRSTLKESIQFIKEGLRSIPNKGVGFGAFATLEETEYTLQDLVPISFNYLGQFDTRQGGDWQVVSEGSGMSADAARDHQLISINGMVSEGKLRFSIVTRLGEEVSKQLSKGLRSHLLNVIKHCEEKLENEGASYTPSDFSMIRISQSLLDCLQSKAISLQNDILHLYAANSLQQGFIYPCFICYFLHA